MATALETTKQIQDQVLASMEQGQKAAVEAVRTWAETVETTFSKVPELAFADPAKPSELLESTFSFTERVFNSNRDFTSRLFEAVLPATRAAAAGTQSAAAQTSKIPSPPKP